ncbi:ParB/RepB/Spo0J family partition protein [Microcoleus sp. herbarium7]|uniref:ParB/RepB/Spo0J family partition protein n=1 Tax=Microcoleus sp. herbarium7 TaxID=3055435 RepID=UPI002FD3E62E
MRKSPKPSARRLRNVTLFSEADEAVPSTLTVPLASIIISATQPRRYFAPSAMQALVESVKKDGVFQPILIRPVGDNYELVAGERRYRAAQEVGLTDIPAVVREMSDTEAVRFALTENLQREDLNSVEETEGILELLAITLEYPTVEVPLLLQRLQKEIKRKKLSHNVMGQTEVDSVPPELAIIQSVFESLGRMSWESFTSNRLPLLNLPADILEAIRSGRIEYTKAKEIAKLESQSLRQELLSEAIADALSLSQIRERIKASQPPHDREEIAARIDVTAKRVKKSKVWENPSKRSRLESLLKQLEELIKEGGVDEAQPIESVAAHQDELQFAAKSSRDSSPIESKRDSLENQKDINLAAVSGESSLQLPQRKVEVLDERKTLVQESSDESRPFVEEEPISVKSESLEPILKRTLTHTELVERLGVKTSTLSVAKKKNDFAEWSKSKDPDAISWQWVTESKCFVPLKN